MIKFPDLYTQIIYDYILKHDDELILYKDIIENYHISYPTIRNRVNWLEKNGYIQKEKRRVKIIPRF